MVLKPDLQCLFPSNLDLAVAVLISIEASDFGGVPTVTKTFE